MADENLQDQKPPVDVDALMAEVERLKGHHSKLLEETKTAKQKAAELEKAQQDAEIARQHEQGEYKGLAEKYKAEAEAERKALLELKGSIANKEMESAAMNIALAEANDPKNAKILARFIRDHLDFVEGAVVGKDGRPVADVIKDMLASGDYDSLRKGNQASGGSAPGSSSSGGAVKKFDEYTGAELSQIQRTDPALYERLKANR